MITASCNFRDLEHSGTKHIVCFARKNTTFMFEAKGHSYLRGILRVLPARTALPPLFVHKK